MRKIAGRCERECASVPGDPAMVFVYRMASILPMVRASLPVYAQPPDCCWTRRADIENPRVDQKHDRPDHV